MKKIRSCIKERVVRHEIGHLFTLILFAKANINTRQIKSLNFPLVYTEYEGMVESEGRIDSIDFNSTAEEVQNVIAEILPGIINSMSGYALETLFDSTQTFEARFERISPITGITKDYQNINNIRNSTAKYIECKTSINPDSCIMIGMQYIEFLKTNFRVELNEIVNYVLEMDINDTINEKGTELIFKNQKLETLIKYIEALITPELIKLTIAWYEDLAEKHKLVFSNKPETKT